MGGTFTKREELRGAGPRRTDLVGIAADVVTVAIFAAICIAAWEALKILQGAFEARINELSLPMDHGLWSIPRYAGRTLLRMCLALGAALVAAIALGLMAAKCKPLRGTVLLGLDIGQSIPVFGFLSMSIAGLGPLFGERVAVLESASVLAIFSSQVWNLALSFYQSVASIPRELSEASSVFSLNGWQRFANLELPAAMQGLIANAVISFGGGWFFVAQSELVFLGDREMRLPGLGAFVADALERGDTRAILWGGVAILGVIVLCDQFIWRPLLVWAEGFRLETISTTASQSSWFYRWMRGGRLLPWAAGAFICRFREGWASAPRNLGIRDPGLWDSPFGGASQFTTGERVAAEGAVARRGALERTRLSARFGRWLAFFAGAGSVWVGMLWAMQRGVDAGRLWSVGVWLEWLRLGLLSLSRVAAVVVLSSIVWVPIGVWLGRRPQLSKHARMLAEWLSAFPVNVLYPVVLGLLAALGGLSGTGCLLLLLMGSQWYVFLNVMEAASAVPGDLREAATVYGLRGWALWQTLWLPGVFGSWVTGACTAAGAAWNASIVAELAFWRGGKLEVEGLGAAISAAWRRGDTLGVFGGVVVMSVLVVLTHRLMWRRLYDFAQKRFRLD